MGADGPGLHMMKTKYITHCRTAVISASLQSGQGLTGRVRGNGTFTALFEPSVQRAEQSQQECFQHQSTAVQGGMVHLTILPWNAPKMMYHVLSTLSGPPCPHFHLWCLPSVFSRSASVLVSCQLPQPSGTNFSLFRFSFCCQGT